MNTKLLRMGQGEDTEKDVREMGLEEAYNNFILLVASNTQEYQWVRYGINIKFDIYNYFQGNMKIYKKKEMMIIHKKIYKLDAIYTELENRIKIIKKVLLELTNKNKEIVQMRGIEEIMKGVEQR